MITSMNYGVIVLVIAALAEGCMTGQPRHFSRDVPEGVVAVTDKQKALVAWVRNLQAGVNKNQVRKALGAATEETKDVWFYSVPESTVSGGYYVTATFTFDRNIMSAAKVRYGHEEKAPPSDR